MKPNLHYISLRRRIDQVLPDATDEQRRATVVAAIAWASVFMNARQESEILDSAGLEWSETPMGAVVLAPKKESALEALSKALKTREAA